MSCLLYFFESIVIAVISIQFSGYSYTYTESAGNCEFSNPDYDSDYGWTYYDNEYHYDYDYAEEDKEQCLQSCLQKSRKIDHAVGCYFWKTYGQCIFIKSGTIVGASGIADTGTCWRFHLGKKYSIYDYCSKIYII